MIVPSIDIQDGQAVQLIGGEKKAIDAGDPLKIAEKFSRAGELAVIDLDAAMGRGSNAGVIRQLVRRYSCRVGGGVRTREAALDWLDAGAQSVILGTAARPDLLAQLPKQRVWAALDARDDRVVVDGWQTTTARSIAEGIAELKEHVAGFLITFVEREGRLVGTDMDRAARLIEAAKPARVTIAGGVCRAEEIAQLDVLGADAQVGMALYNGDLSLADGFAAPLRSDRPDGLWPTVVCDSSGVALGLVYSDRESLSEAIETGQGVYHSRSRGLWRKGATSGATQQLLRAELDCDRDCLRFIVRQQGAGFCHQERWSCWEAELGLGELERTIAARQACAPAGSYTRRLLDDAQLLADKVREEAEELTQARSREETIWEAADLLYFTLVTSATRGVSLAEVEAHLAARHRAVRRRGEA